MRRLTLDAWLAAVEAREQKATKGPWMFDERDPDNRAVKALQAGGRQKQHVVYPAGMGANGDCFFIAHARTDVPTLVEMVRRAVEGLTQIAGEYKNDVQRVAEADEPAAALMAHAALVDLARLAREQGERG